MTAAFDGLSNIYSLTAQINSLKDQATKSTNSSTNNIDPQLALLNIQKNFNEMLNDLTSSDKEKEENSDSLISLINNYQTATNNTANSNNTQNNILMEQYKLNLNNIF